MKNLLILLLLSINTIVLAQEPSNNEIVMKKDGYWDPQFVINDKNVGFWLVGKDYAKNYSIDTSKISIKSPVHGFISKINDNIFASISLLSDDVYITHDFGKTWELYFTKPMIKYTSFHFIDENNIVFVDKNSNMVKSSDKGKTWVKIFEKNADIKNISSKVYFKDTNNGIFYRKYTVYDSNGYANMVCDIFYTTDGGIKWSISDEKEIKYVWKIYNDNNKYFILTIDGKIYRSTDVIGNKWEFKTIVDHKKAVYTDLDKGLKVDRTSFKPFVLFYVY